MKIAIIGAGNVGKALAKSSIKAGHQEGFVAGDDQAAKDKVLALVEAIGFRPIDAGPLVMARVLEGMALLNVSLQIRNNWPWKNGWKLVGPPND